MDEGRDRPSARTDRGVRRRGKRVRVSIDKPANVSSRKLANGHLGWYWRPGPKDMKKKCPIIPRALGADAAIAFNEANELNDELKRWRAGLEFIALPPGTIGWLLDGFLKNPEIALGSASNQANYQRLTRYICNLKMKGGGTFGDRKLQGMKVAVASGMHSKLVELHSVDVANRALKMIKYAWDLQYPLHESIIPPLNIFGKIKRGRAMRHVSKETQPATHDELQSFISGLIAQGEVGLAFGARCIWDMHIRPEEMFGTAHFDHWRPAEKPGHMFVNVEKTDTASWLIIDYEGQCMLPELQSLYNMLPYSGGLLCQRERRAGKRIFAGEWMPIQHHSKLTKKYREMFGLGEHFTMAAIRHGGLTSLGSSSDHEIQSRSRHKQRQTLSRYLHASDEDQYRALLARKG